MPEPKFKGYPVKSDAEEIASLKQRIKTVENRLAAIQQENSEYQKKIVNLSQKLKSTENKLAKLSNPLTVEDPLLKRL